MCSLCCALPGVLALTLAIQLQQSIQTASHELAYERSSREVAAAIRDEDVRKLKFQLIVLEDENDVLDEQLSRAEENAEALENDLGEALARQGELESEFQTMANELRTKLREAESMRVGSALPLADLRKLG